MEGIGAYGYHFLAKDSQNKIFVMGNKSYGQLGTGNKRNFIVPQKLIDIPPVVSVSCGFEHIGYSHTLIQICGHANIMNSGNYVLETKKIN